MRKVTEEGGLKESSWQHGVTHGYVRGIGANGSYYTGLNKNGKKIGEWMFFDFQGNVMDHYRVDEDG